MSWKTLRGILLDNLTLKVIAVVLAFLLWVQIAGQQRVQRSVAVPLEFINMPAALEITNDYPRQVNVIISRPSSLRMDEQSLAAVIDLSGTEPGSTIVPVTERNIRGLPSGVQIEGIELRRIRLQLERLRRKTVRVEPEVVGQPGDGFQIREVRAVPSEVLISGPESKLEQVTIAGTEPIDVAGRTRTFTQRVYLDLSDPGLRIENASSVEVVVVIEEQRRQVRLRVPIRLLPEGTRGRVSPRSVNATVSLPISFGGEVGEAEFYAYVTIPSDESASLEGLPVIVAIPEEVASLVRVESVEPAVVNISLERRR